MSFNIKEVQDYIRDLAKKEQQKQLIENIMKSSNQPSFPSSEDMDALYNFVNGLPEEQKYNMLFDSKVSDTETITIMQKPENKEALDKLNAKFRKTQLEMIQSAKNIEFKGVIKVLIEELPRILLRHISSNLADHISISTQESLDHTHGITKGSIPLNE